MSQNISIAAGTRFFIGPVIQPSTDTVTEFNALTYVEVKGVESIGEYGPTKQDVTFTPLDTGISVHLGGSSDNGSIPVNCAWISKDTGQLAMIAASNGNGSLVYAFKIINSDPDTGSGVATISFLRGKVQGYKRNIADANNIVRINFTVGIDATELLKAST